ncbi:MAG: 2Fe-2S iron-sulfur cluster-binding protein [Actinomycetota bacterium]
MTSSNSGSQQSRRLGTQHGEVIDRSRLVTFTWNGRTYTGFSGDSVVSALAASGERVFSRSFKYHRPRGLMTATMHDPGCTMQIDDEPNVRGAHRLLQNGMKATSQNTWPSLRFDVRAVNQLGSRFLAPGFYYKTFMKPQFMWPVYERVLRQFVHAGRVNPEITEEIYEKRYAHVDVLVVGGGPAGMTSALAASAAGARVMLVDEEHQLGGHLRWTDPEHAAKLAKQVLATENIHTLTNSTVAACYDDNWCAVVQRQPSPCMPETLIKTRARSLVVAAGLIERPYVFEGNDLPGVMLSTAAQRLINLHAVKPGERAVVLTANPEGDAAAEDLRRIGVEVEVVDARAGETVVRAHGRNGVQAVELSNGRKIAADLLVTATGWTAPTSLLNMSGDVPYYVPEAARFLPGGQSGEGVYSTGGLAGDGTMEQLQDHADAVGQHAAHHALSARTKLAGAVPTVPSTDTVEPRPIGNLPAIFDMPVPDHPALFRSTTHGIVDFSEDVSSRDLYSAVKEGYDSAELAKRFTTVTMGPTQGKIELVNAIAVIADATGRSIAETGTTTWRPMYAPVTLGALAGRNYDPVRYSPIQPWHQSRKATPLVAGQWIRPDHYGDPEAEVRAVREKVGIIDVTPIGKFDLRGPDVSKLLNQLYVNKWSKLEIGRVRYGAMCADDGVVLDDGVTGRLGENHYLMTTTTSGAAGIWEWIEEWLQTAHPEWQVHVTPVTTAYASINVAGPLARKLVSRLVDGIDMSSEGFGYMRLKTGRVAGVDDCVLWRIGFTGELSYELHVPAGYGLHVWESLMAAGEDLGVAPFGVEAQRILRLEKGHLIVGQDTDGLTQGYSAGLDWAIKLDKEDFSGKPELLWQQQSGSGTRLASLQPLDPAVVPAEASQILGPDGHIRGRITSSRHSPTLKRSVCLAQLERALSEPGTVVDIRLPDAQIIKATVMQRLAHVDPEGTRLENDTTPASRVQHSAPVARGPLPLSGPAGTVADWEVSVREISNSLKLHDYSALAKIGVRASPTGSVASALKAGFGRTHQSEQGTLVVGSGPGEWIVLGEPGNRAKTLQEMQQLTDQADEHASTVDLTHGRALFLLTGEHAAKTLSKVCAIDFSDDLIPDGAALRSTVAGIVTDLIRHDNDDGRSYLLHCERSSGLYLHSAMLDAGREYEIGDGGYPVSKAGL